jgi:hypothetical protein
MSAHFWVPVLLASTVLAMGLFLVVWLFCGGPAKKRRLRCGVSDEVRDRLNEFVAVVNPVMVLDGKKEKVRQAGEKFDWGVVSERAVMQEDRVGNMNVKIVDSTIEKTSPMVWSAVAICELTSQNKKKPEGGKEKQKILDAMLIICHLDGGTF